MKKQAAFQSVRAHVQKGNIRMCTFNGVHIVGQMVESFKSFIIFLTLKSPVIFLAYRSFHNLPYSTDCSLGTFI